MNAKELGAKLLSEVEETNLQELLEDLQASLSCTTSTSPRSYFDLPSLDYIINVFLPPINLTTTTTTTDINITATTTSPNGAQPKARSRPPIVELTSQSPGSGKTHLLYQLIASCVTGDGTTAHKPAAALVFDTDARFSIPRLAEIVRARIVSLTSLKTTTTSVETETNTDSNIDELLHIALQNVHIFRPSSLASLVSTLHSLPSYLLAPPEKSQHYSGSRAVGLLVIDSASAFFWQERMAAEGGEGAARDDEAETLQERSRAPEEDGEEREEGTAEQVNKNLTIALLATQDLFACPILYTTITLSSPSSTTFSSNDPNAAYPILTNSPLSQPLSALPSSFPTLRLLCTRNAVKRFPAAMSMQALLLDRGARQAVVDKGGFRVDVVPGGSVWARDDGVKERLRRGGGKARAFVMVVEGKGVGFE